MIYDLRKCLFVIPTILFSGASLQANNSTDNISETNKDIAGSQEQLSLIRDNRAAFTVGGSTVTISGDRLRETSHLNLAEALIGRVPGLIVRTNNSEPGNEAYSLSIRGYGKAPLVLVDGLVSGIAGVNVNDVESVTIMKDAATTVLYGMDASGGIISIKTKTGHYKEPEITVRAGYSLQSPLKKPNVLGSSDHVRLVTQAWENDGMPERNMYTKDEIDGYINGTDRSMFPDNDWYDMFMNDYVSTFNVHTGAMGGTDRLSYYTSIGYTNQSSPFKADEALKDYGLDRFDIRSNIDLKVNDFIRAFVNARTRIDRQNLTAAKDGNQGVVESIFDLPPTAHGPLTQDGHVVVTPDKQDPTYGRLNRNGYTKQSDVDFGVNIGVEFDLKSILKGLKTTGRFKYTTNILSNTKGYTDYVRYTRDLNKPQELEFYQFGITENTPLAFSKSSISSLRRELDWQLSYDRTFGDHYVSAAGFLRHTYQNLDGIEGFHPVKGITYGARATYGYDNILFADYALSYQGSEQFAPGKRYGFFNSGSLSLVLSNMGFLEDNDVVNYLKLKGSLGRVGSDNFGDERFIYQDFLDPQANGRYLNYLGNKWDIIRLGNPNLTWEKSTIANAGVEASLWNNLFLGVEYFQNRWTDVLINDNMTPQIGGVGTSLLPMVNAGENINRGVDLQIAYTHDFNKDISVGFNGNMVFSKRKVIESGELPRVGYDYEYINNGFLMGQNWGYEIDFSNGNGYFNTADELANNNLKYNGKQPRLGDFIYKDQNGDNVIDDKDIVPMGQTKTPQISWGAEAFMKVKDFDLSIMMQGLAKYGAFYNGIGYYENFNSGTFFEQHLNAWTPDRFANGEEISGPALSMNGSSSQRANDYYYQNKNFFRIKNIKLGYDVPMKTSVLDLYVYANVVNAFTFDHLMTNNHDIEGNKINAFGTARYWTVGVNLNF